MIAKIYSIADDDEAIDAILTECNDLFCAGDFEACDFFLTLINVEDLNTVRLIALLAATLPAADKLKSRAALYEKIEARLRVTEAPERVERLLRGLRSAGKAQHERAP